MAVDKSVLLRQKGQSLFLNKEYEEAEKVLTEAIVLNPDYYEAYIDLAKVFSVEKKYEDAIANSTMATVIKPSAEAYISLARNYLDSGDTDKAIINAMNALKEKPDDVDTFKLLHNIYGNKSGLPGFTTDSKQGATFRRYKENIDLLKLSGETKTTVEMELEKLNYVDFDDRPSSPQDFASTKNYLDMIIALPWNDAEPVECSLKEASEILDEEHYGLNDVKNRILEFLAVRKMQQNKKGAILCFAGPPGVGKTSIGKSIAATLGRKFYRFSVGGISDGTSIRGGGKMWVGSGPGRIMKGLKITESKSPVILIDEVDKLSVGGTNMGDPSGALLEVLDPEQNSTFRDSYLDIPFDLSNVLFILTANDLTRLPTPLLDRLEIIKISGYIEAEKMQIAKKHLIPKCIKKNGLDQVQVAYTDEAILHLVNSYDKEPGVRTLEQNIDKIHRKLSREIIEQKETGDLKDEKKSFIIDKQTVEKFLGEPRFKDTMEDTLKADRPGMAIGLAVSGGVWGVPLQIETISIPGEEGFTVTGNMITPVNNGVNKGVIGINLMKESVEIAYSYARKYAIEHKYRDISWFKENHIHIHFPNSNPKDGPSAGIVIATALLSLFMNKNVKDNIAMTGEITLTGQVLAIGGLKEKIIGAISNKSEHVIFPKQNLRDLDEIDDVVKDGIKFFHSVERFEEVFALAFPE